MHESACAAFPCPACPTEQGKGRSSLIARAPRGRRHPACIPGGVEVVCHGRERGMSPGAGRNGERAEETSSTRASRQKEYTGVNALMCPVRECPLSFVGITFGKWDRVQSIFDRAGVDSRIPVPLLRSG